jgi:hypothetical protein
MARGQTSLRSGTGQSQSALAATFIAPGICWSGSLTRLLQNFVSAHVHHFEDRRGIMTQTPESR